MPSGLLISIFINFSLVGVLPNIINYAKLGVFSWLALLRVNYKPIPTVNRESKLSSQLSWALPCCEYNFTYRFSPDCSVSSSKLRRSSIFTACRAASGVATTKFSLYGQLSFIILRCSSPKFHWATLRKNTITSRYIGQAFTKLSTTKANNTAKGIVAKKLYQQRRKL